MVRQEVLRRRIDQVEHYLRVLRGMQRYSEDEFVNDPDVYGAADRFLHLSIEAINDMAAHVLADHRLVPANHYRDLSRVFLEKGWIDETQYQRWIRMIGFRNVLVHDYLAVDRNLVYTILQNQLDDLDELAAVFSRFL